MMQLLSHGTLCEDPKAGGSMTLALKRLKKSGGRGRKRSNDSRIGRAPPVMRTISLVIVSFWPESFQG
jgi:hypothetical protein